MPPLPLCGGGRRQRRWAPELRRPCRHLRRLVGEGARPTPPDPVTVGTPSRRGEDCSSCAVCGRSVAPPPAALRAAPSPAARERARGRTMLPLPRSGGGLGRGHDQTCPIAARLARPPAPRRRLLVLRCVREVGRAPTRRATRGTLPRFAGEGGWRYRPPSPRSGGATPKALGAGVAAAMPPLTQAGWGGGATVRGYSITIFGPADPRAATFSRRRVAIFW